MCCVYHTVASASARAIRQRGHDAESCMRNGVTVELQGDERSCCPHARDRAVESAPAISATTDRPVVAAAALLLLLVGAALLSQAVEFPDELDGRPDVVSNHVTT